jgi:hypothetical protein
MTANGNGNGNGDDNGNSNRNGNRAIFEGEGGRDGDYGCSMAATRG